MEIAVKKGLLWGKGYFLPQGGEQAGPSRALLLAASASCLGPGLGKWCRPPAPGSLGELETLARPRGQAAHERLSAAAI